MKIAGEGKLLRIFIGESDTLHGHSLYDVLVRKARELGLAGATVWRGIEGYGAASRIHTAKILRLSEDLPILIEIVMNNSSGIYQVDGLLKAKLKGSGLEPYVEVLAHIDTEAEKRLVPLYRLEI